MEVQGRGGLRIGPVMYVSARSGVCYTLEFNALRTLANIHDGTIIGPDPRPPQALPDNTATDAILTVEAYSCSHMLAPWGLSDARPCPG